MIWRRKEDDVAERKWWCEGGKNVMLRREKGDVGEET